VLAIEYGQALAAGATPSVNTVFATYFTLTGVHAVHVALGAAGNVWALAGVSRVPAALTRGRLAGLSWYWAFVGIVWLLMFGLFYLS
jgi:heme/copper-type cytochrome/quinol oxidase subunit 3